MFLQYIKMHRRMLVFCGVFFMTAWLMITLYQLPGAAVVYTALICAFFGAVFMAADYAKFRRHHRLLVRLAEEVGVTLDNLPEPSCLPEADYQELVRGLYAQKQALEEQDAARYQELVDYYTAWVHQVKTPIAAMRLMLQGAAAPRPGVSSAPCSGVPAAGQDAVSADTWDGGEPGECSASALSTQLPAELGEELQRIEQYVDMVLCYLRLDSESSDYVIREYDLDSIIRQAVRRNATTFIRKRLSLNYEPTRARVVTDEKWLLFVIEQILSNALKYTQSGSITITLEQPKTLCIKDTGIGIAPDDLPRVFERGYTGMNGRTDKKASGIGLYLCRRICRNLGHLIFITSTPGAGTEVRLDIKNAELEVD